MKKLLLILLLALTSAGVSAQALNAYKYAIVPTKFEWQSKDNQYRLSTLTKSLFADAGFVVYYDNEQLPSDVASDRCNKVYVDVRDVSSLLNIKVDIVIRDCTNKELFRSKTGNSKEKNFETAYHAALREAFASFKAMDYKYAGTAISVPVTNTAVKVTEVPAGTTATGLVVETVSTGFLIIDPSASNIVLRLYRSAKAGYYIAVSKGRNGIAYKSGDAVVFEYYEADQLRSESFAVQLN